MDFSKFTASEETAASTIQTGVNDFLLKLINPTNAELVSIMGYKPDEKEKSYIYKNGTMAATMFGIDGKGKSHRIIYQCTADIAMRDVWEKDGMGGWCRATKDGQPLSVQVYCDNYGRTQWWDNESKSFINPTEGYKMHKGEAELLNTLRIILGFNDKKDATPITIKFIDNKAYLSFVEGKKTLMDCLDISVPQDKWKINKVWIHLYGEKETNGTRYWAKADTEIEAYWSKDLTYWEKRFMGKMRKRIADGKVFYPSAALTITPIHDIGSDVLQSTLPATTADTAADTAADDSNDLPF